MLIEVTKEVEKFGAQLSVVRKKLNVVADGVGEN